MLIILLLIAFAINCFAKVPVINFEMKNYYNDNILHLSESDKNSFKDNLKLDKFHIHSLDDIITSVKSEIVFKHKYFYNHTQKIKLSQKYEKFWFNQIKDNYSFYFTIQQYLNRRINFSISYFFYPKIYVNHYKSVLENGIYREFSYSKNVYQSVLRWKVLSFASLNYKFEFSQLYYNEYFTEYDADNLYNEIKLILSPASKIDYNVSYGYRDSKADGEGAYSGQIWITDLKDPSYELNSYRSVLRFRSFIFKQLDLNFGFTYQEKYYLSPIISDEYHYARDEFIKIYSISPKYTISKALKLSLFAKYTERAIRSPFSNVIRDKEYDNYQIGLNIALNLF